MEQSSAGGAEGFSSMPPPRNMPPPLMGQQGNQTMFYSGGQRGPSQDYLDAIETANKKDLAEVVIFS